MENSIIKEKYLNEEETYTKISEFLDDKEINIWFKTQESNNKALIWLPGYQDYYYHFHVGSKLLDNNCDIWALFPNNYGESIKKNPDYAYHMNTLDEYLPQIDIIINKAINHKNYDEVLLYGHSLGGLTSIYYCHKGNYKEKISRIILNSPFLSIRKNIVNEYIKYFVESFIYYYGRYFKETIIKPRNYKPNILKDEIKKNFYFSQYFIVDYHPEIRSGLIQSVLDKHYQINDNKINIEIPILVLYPEKGAKIELLISDDTIIGENINKIGNNITKKSIKGALHDVLSSEPEISNQYIDFMINWIDNSNQK